MLQKNYETASLYAPAEGTWFIIWYNRNPATDKLERVRKTFQLNRISDMKQRKATAATLITIINTALANGWNFFVEGLPELNIDAAPPEITMAAAFEKGYAVKIIGNKRSSVLSFSSVASIFRTWLQQSGYADKPLSQFRAPQFQEYIFARLGEGVGPRNINAHINLVRAVFTKLVSPLELLPANPLAGFAMLDEPDSDLYEPLTHAEMQATAKALQEFNPRLLLFCYFIHYGCMRPEHICLLQRSQIDFQKSTLQIRGITTKSKRSTSKQLLTPLRDLLLELKVDELPPASYIFSSRRFDPGSRCVHSLSNRASEDWKKIVQDGLGILKKMYALKHTFGTFYVMENAAPDPMWLMGQMEHSSLDETMAYIHRVKVKRIDESTVKGTQF